MGDLELSIQLGIYGHLCQALDPADKSVTWLQCDVKSPAKQMTLSLPPVSFEPDLVFLSL